VDNCESQLEAAAGVDVLELLDEELELELSDLADSAFFSEEPLELDDSELADPFDELLAASRLSVR
jgi:hypothetical protein